MIHEQTTPIKLVQGIRLFSPGMERFVLAVPIGFLLLALVEISQQQIAPNEQTTNFTRVIYNFVFLNFIHVFFTFAMILKVPQLITWRQTGRGSSKIPLSIELGLIGVITLLALSVVLFWVPDSPVSLFVLLAIVYLPLHHAIIQSFGLSMCYNVKASRQGLLAKEDEAELPRLQLQERIGFHVVLISHFGWSFIEGLKLKSPGLHSPFLESFQTIALAVTAMAAIFTFSLGFRYKGEWAGYKRIFLSRVFIIALAPFSLFAAMAMGCVHGTEYLGVVERVGENSQSKSFSKKTFYMWVGIFGLVALLVGSTNPFLGLSGFIYNESGTISQWAYGFVLLTGVFTFIHYYLDRKLFKMSRSHNRKHVLPLLVD